MKHRSAPKDPRGGHVRLYWAILDSPAWRALTHAAFVSELQADTRFDEGYFVVLHRRTFESLRCMVHASIDSFADEHSTL